MGPAISEILPLAVVAALSPVPIIGVILMLFSPRARTDGPMFLLGWVVGLTVVITATYLIADGADVATDSGASDGASTVKVVLGVVLILMGLRHWRSRPAPGEAAPLPKWMAAIDHTKPLQAAGLGVLLSAVNPKNLILTVAAGLSVAQAGLSSGDTVVVLIVYVVIASLTILVPVVGYLFAGDRMRATLDGWKVWLQQNNAAVMTVLLVVIGVVVLAKGLGLLTA